MVSACVRSGQYFEALRFFRDMQCHGVQPNHVSVQKGHCIFS
jgi:pentatricopeptide repeat protein